MLTRYHGISCSMNVYVQVVARFGTTLNFFAKAIGSALSRGSSTRCSISRVRPSSDRRWLNFV